MRGSLDRKSSLCRCSARRSRGVSECGLSNVVDLYQLQHRDRNPCGNRTLIAKQVDGILLTVADVQNSEGLNLIRSRELPHSLLFNEAPAGQVSWSVGDHAAAAMVADVLRKQAY